MIGIFDSGIGGVTIFREILKELPNYNYIYYSDSLNNPYGDKSPQELLKITRNICKYLIDKGCKIIVIACNTASAMCKDALREEFKVPIIAVEPALKMVYDNAIKGNTLIMATKGTTDSKNFKELYQKYGNQMSILECPGLADLIEEDNIPQIKEYLLKRKEYFQNIDNLVLGCTHYPLIEDILKELFNISHFYEGSKGVTNHLKEVISKSNVKETAKNLQFVDSSNSKLKEARFYRILNTYLNK